MKLTRLGATTLLAAAALAGGCGGDDESDSPAQTAATPATQAATVPATVPTAVPETTTPEDGTATTPTDDPNRTDPITLNGRLGDALSLVGQSGYKKPSKTKVEVTVKKISGPFSGFDLPANREMIGVELTIKNVGEEVYDDPQPGGRLTMSSGESGKQTSLIVVNKKNPCDNPSLKLKTGASKSVCIAYDVPKSGKPQTFEFAVDSGYGDTGLWKLG